jgi:hypothetical protein
VGLLRAAFRPEEEICAVRTLFRHRSELIQAATQHVQHMHKSLTQMNLQIHHVISDITGVTGLAIVDAILAGERDATALAKLRDSRIKADAETIRKSLVGSWRPEHLFTLRQSREFFRTYQQRIVECDLEIEQRLPKFEPRVNPAETPLPPDQKRNRAGKKRRRKNGHPNPGFDLRTEAYKLFGVDVTQVPGLEENALPLFSEVGRDMTKWPSAGHFASWLNLCPDNDISGGKTLWRGMRTVENRAGHLLRLAASSLPQCPIIRFDPWAVTYLYGADVPKKDRSPSSGNCSQTRKERTSSPVRPARRMGLDAIRSTAPQRFHRRPLPDI